MKTYSLSILVRLENKQSDISIEEIPKPFHKDLLSFLMGHTFMPNKNGKLMVGNALYSDWITKLCTKGFDEDVNLVLDGK